MLVWCEWMRLCGCAYMCMHVCAVLVLVCICDREEQGSENAFLPPLCWDCRCVPACVAFYMGAGDRNSVLMSHHHILKFLSTWLFLCLCMCFCVHYGFFLVICTFRKYPSLYPAFSLLSFDLFLVWSHPVLCSQLSFCLFLSSCAFLLHPSKYSTLLPEMLSQVPPWVILRKEPIL